MNARASKVPHPLSKLAALKTRMKTLACSHGQSVSPSAETKKYLAEKHVIRLVPIRDPRLFSRPSATDVTEGARISSHPTAPKVPRSSPWRAVRCPSRGSRDARCTARAPAWPPSPGRTPRTSRPCPRRTRSSSGPPQSRSSSRISPSSQRPSRRYVETRARGAGTVRCTLSARRRRSAPRGSAFSPARTRRADPIDRGDPIVAAIENKPSPRWIVMHKR